MLLFLHSSCCSSSPCVRNDLRDVVQWRGGGLALLFPHLASLPLPVDRLPFLAWNHVSTELFIASNGSELSPAQLNRTWRIICGQQQKTLCSLTSSTVAVFTFCPPPQHHQVKMRFIHRTAWELASSWEICCGDCYFPCLHRRQASRVSCAA